MSCQHQDSVKRNSPSKINKQNSYPKSDHEAHVSNLLETLAVQDEEPPSDDIKLGTHGLPIAFGCRKNAKSEEASEVRPTLKRTHDTDEDGVYRIRSAYMLLGLAHGSSQEWNSPTNKMQGRVVYRKKHIRLQNRHLNINRNPVKPKHVYFDDSGNLIPDPIDKVELFLKSQSNELEASNPMCVSSDDDSDHVPKANSAKRLMLDIPSEKQTKSEDESINEGEGARSRTTSTGNVDMLKFTNDSEYFGIPPMDESQNIKKKEKKKKRKNSVPNDIRDDPVMMKYWFKRFSLFSKFDQGITLDRGICYTVIVKVHINIYGSFFFRKLVFCDTRKNC